MTQSTSLVFVAALALSALSGCSDAPQPAATEPVAQAPASAPIVTGKYIPATVVPVTNEKRQALLDSLKDSTDNSTNNSTNNNAEQYRLSLFVRYTLMADNKNRQLDALEQLTEQISTLASQYKDDYELTALLGSATSLQAAFYPDNLGKTNLLAKKGSRYLDRAVKKAPKHLGVRLYRGITYTEMPAFLGKARQAVDDFSLLKMAMGPQMPQDFAAMVDYYFGLALIKDQQQKPGVRMLETVAKQNIQPWSMRAVLIIKEQG